MIRAKAFYNGRNRGGFGLLLLIILAAATVFLIYKKSSTENKGFLETLGQALADSPVAKVFGVNDNCRFPVSWSVGKIDQGFNVGRSDLETAVDKAAALWKKAVGTKLFVESPTGLLKIGLVYDERQKETDMLRKLGLTIDQSKESFDRLQTSYGGLNKTYEADKADYELKAKNFEAEDAALQTIVNYWNAKGGAPKQEYLSIQAKQDVLQKEFEALDQSRIALNNEVSDLNNLAAVLNQAAKELNLKVNAYNSGGATVRNVFEAGVYESDQAGKRIFVYQFEDKNKLTSVLAHEFGHALGLEHNDDPNSIMYKLNQGQVQSITATDIAALKKECPNLK